MVTLPTLRITGKLEWEEPGHKTRMHSSRMRTARNSSRRGGVPGLGGKCLLRGGVPGLGEVYLVLGDVCSEGGCLLPEEGYLVGGCTRSWGVSAPGGCNWSGMYLVLGGVCSRGGLLLGGCTWSGTPPCGQTHACKHITLPQTSFAGGNNHTSWVR